MWIRRHSKVAGNVYCNRRALRRMNVLAITIHVLSKALSMIGIIRMHMLSFLLLPIFLLPLSMHVVCAEEAGPYTSRLQGLVEEFRNDAQDKKSTYEKLASLEADLNNDTEVELSAESLLLLGRCFFYASADAKAERVLKKTLEKDAGLANAHFFLGLIRMYAKDDTRGLDYFKRACALEPKNVAYQFELARCYERLAKNADARKVYEQIILLEPKQHMAYYGLGALFASEKNYAQAEVALKFSSTLNPAHINSHYNLAQMYQLQGKNAEALELFQRVVDLDQTDYRSLAKVIQCSRSLSDFEREESARTAMYALWKSAAVQELTEQGFYIRDQFTHGGHRFFVLEYFELKGGRALRYKFMEKDGAGASVRNISLGSYATTTAVARESGSIAEDARMFHVDAYYPNGLHETYAMLTEEPSYHETRAVVMKILNEELQPISSTEPSKK